MRHILLAAALSLFATQASSEPRLPDNLRQGFGFDFYVLALSWSPSWCGENDPAGRSRQCDLDRDYRFIVHGLWPQFERGYPEYCEKSERDVSRRFEDALLPIMPSRGLIQRQWDKHGSCAGLRQAEYFATLAHAWKAVRVPDALNDLRRDRRLPPDEIEGLFASANPGLDGDEMSVVCRRGELREVRICLTKDLAFRSCPEVDRRGCSGPRALDIPAPR